MAGVTNWGVPVEYPESGGYVAAPGYIKQNPLNNAWYIWQLRREPWYPVLRTMDAALEEIAPGYNISCIEWTYGRMSFRTNLQSMELPDQALIDALNVVIWGQNLAAKIKRKDQA